MERMGHLDPASRHHPPALQFPLAGPPWRSESRSCHSTSLAEPSAPLRVLPCASLRQHAGNVSEGIRMGWSAANDAAEENTEGDVSSAYAMHCTNSEGSELARVPNYPQSIPRQFGESLSLCGGVIGARCRREPLQNANADALSSGI